MNAIFLSASVPDPNRDPKYYRPGDVSRIRDAVDALVTAVLPRGMLVWGGHPAIAPFVRRVAEALGKTGRVKTYQSAWFRGQESPDTRALPDVVWTPAGRDLDDSVAMMRAPMLDAQPLAAAVFIGGMEGIEREHAMFTERFPAVPTFAVASTGGAAQILADRHPQPDRVLQERLRADLLYDLLFEDLLAPLLDVPAYDQQSWSHAIA